MIVEIFLAVVVVVFIIFILSIFSGSTGAVGTGIWFFVAEAAYKLMGLISSFFVIGLCLLAIYWGTAGRF